MNNLNHHISIPENMGVVANQPHPFYDVALRALLEKVKKPSLFGCTVFLMNHLLVSAPIFVKHHSRLFLR